jgi:protein-S-isoprenylcysteine O-methyltransferase Ste14
MKKIASKDIIFVSIQLILFVIYFTPLFSFPFHLNVFLKYAALVFAFIGLVIILVAILQLNKNLTPFPTPKESGTLIQQGLYNYIRHPIYTGIILTTTGFGLFDESIWKITIGIALWVLFYFKSRYEENLLAKHFSEYNVYRERTGRFFPFV